MLLQFTVENFLSFHEPTTLSLLGAPHVEHKPHQLVGQLNGRSILRCAAVYGANASGKSNLFKALNWASFFIRNGTRSDQPISVPSFRLASPQEASPVTRFEFHVSYGEKHYSYGFAVSSRAVEEEWLIAHEADHERTLFDRTAAANGTGSSEIKLGSLPGLSPKRLGFFEYVIEGTRPNQLFLTEARERNVEEFKEIAEELVSVLPVHSESRNTPIPLREVEASPELREFMLAILSSASTGVEGLAVRKTAHGMDKELLFSSLFQAIPNITEPVHLNSTTELHRRDDGKFESRSLLAQRRANGGSVVDFDVASEESDGTRRLLELSLMLLPRDRPRVFVVDEIERSLHPVLTRFLVSRFLEDEDNTSQLIFTTHDTNLLDHSLLSPDSIWFTEKNAHGATEMYSLAEFKPEQLSQFDQNLEQGYLRGRFGAIPFLGKPSVLTPPAKKAQEEP